MVFYTFGAYKRGDTTETDIHADVYIDGDNVGVTPVRLEVSVVPHNIELVKAGYITYEATWTPQPGGGWFDAEMIPATMGSMTVRSFDDSGNEILDAKVFLDGTETEIGLTTLIEYAITPGQHTLIVKKAGYNDSEPLTFTAVAGEWAYRDLTLIPLPTFRVSIGSTPGGASVEIDGADIGGPTPDSGRVSIYLTEGDHTFLLTKDGYKWVESPNEPMTIYINAATNLDWTLEEIGPGVPPLSEYSTITIAAIDPDLNILIHPDSTFGVFTDSESAVLVDGDAVITTAIKRATDYLIWSAKGNKSSVEADIKLWKILPTKNTHYININHEAGTLDTDMPYEKRDFREQAYKVAKDGFIAGVGGRILWANWPMVKVLFRPITFSLSWVLSKLGYKGKLGVGAILSWITGSWVARSIMGAAAVESLFAFLMFIAEETDQKAGFPCYIVKGMNDPVLMEKAVVQYRKTIDFINAEWFKISRDIDPIAGRFFNAYFEAATFGLEVYEEILKKQKEENTHSGGETPPAGVSILQDARVVKVLDGDTIHVRWDHKTYVVRWVGINCPEISHPGNKAEYGGNAARIFIDKILHDGTFVDVLIDPATPLDLYGRLLGVVKLSGIDLNLLLLEVGGARTLFIGTNKNVNTSAYKAAENNAMKNKLGIWNLNTPPKFIVPPEIETALGIGGDKQSTFNVYGAADPQVQKLTAVKKDVSGKGTYLITAGGKRKLVSIDDRDEKDVRFTPEKSGKGTIKITGVESLDDVTIEEITPIEKELEAGIYEIEADGKEKTIEIKPAAEKRITFPPQEEEEEGEEEEGEKWIIGPDGTLIKKVT